MPAFFMNQKHKFVIVGGGTAGMMTAALFKTYWQDKADVTVVYDHKNPGIGVGESLTPIFISFLERINIKPSDLVKHCNSTFKLGLKFKNWTHNNYYYHPFVQTINYKDDYNFTLASSLINNKNKIFNNEEYIFFDSYYFENSCLPVTNNEVNGRYAMHIDATLFSKFLEQKFKNSIEVIDNNVVDVLKDERSFIQSLVCSDGTKIEGDFFIDASGFQRVLFNHLDSKWNDMKKWLPLDRCIPNPVFCEFQKQPTFTTSEATEDGWILQVPLQNRWGSGYLYSSSFTDDQKAFDKLQSFVKKTYNKDLNNTSKVLKFDSGYYESPWINNCLSVGLSYGFSEPLEATNIHQVAQQINYFIDVYNFKVNQYDVNKFNLHFKKVFENVYTYLRFCYCNGRNDSEFWKYITNNEPKEITFLKEKISKEIVNTFNLDDTGMFNYHNFTLVASGLNLIDKQSYKSILENRLVLNNSITNNTSFKNFKKNQQATAVDHLDFIKILLKS